MSMKQMKCSPPLKGRAHLWGGIRFSVSAGSLILSLTPAALLVWRSSPPPHLIIMKFQHVNELH